MRRAGVLAFSAMLATGILSLGCFSMGASETASGKRQLQRSTMRLQRLTHVDPLAVCYDGSPAGYYWKPSVNGSNVWIVYLQGGGWCHSDESCRKRCRIPVNPLCSSRLWPEDRSFEGLLAPLDDSKLKDANKVHVGYCTSDAHMGDTAAFGHQFRGARVVRATLSDLMRNHGLGSMRFGKDTLIFGGGSAGGRGAMVHLDYLPQLLGRKSNNVAVVGFLDSPLWIDIPSPPFSTFQGFAAQCQDVFDNFNVTHLGQGCIDAYPVEEHWKCIMGQYRMPHVAQPYMLMASSYDSFQLGNIVGHRPSTDDEKQFAEEFAERTVALVTKLRADWPANAPKSNAVFSWACFNHAVSETEAGFDKFTCGKGGISIDAALQQFLGNSTPTQPPPQLEWIERCDGFDCGSGCGHTDVVTLFGVPVPRLFV